MQNSFQRIMVMDHLERLCSAFLKPVPNIAAKEVDVNLTTGFGSLSQATYDQAAVTQWRRFPSDHRT